MQGNNNINTQDEAYNEYWRVRKQITLESYVTLFLIILNCFILVACFFEGEILYANGALVADKVIQNKEIYRMVTSLFLHADLEHLFGNMIMLLFIGPPLEKVVGHLWFGLIYFGAGIAGNIFSIIYEKLSGGIWISYGASGAVFGIVGAMGLIIFYNRKRLKQMGSSLPVRMLFMLIYAIYSGFTNTSVNNAAHIGGLLFGILIMLINVLLYRRNTKLEVYL